MAQIPPPPASQRLSGIVKTTIRSWIDASKSMSRSFRQRVRWNMISVPPPPVPPRLREMLKDYPELIQMIGDDLNALVEKMLREAHFPPYEEAVWYLEDKLEALYIRAESEAKAAELGGDPELIDMSKQKCFLIGRTRSVRPWHDRSEHSLWKYFETYKAAFE
jgi:hypothetical protein